MGSVQLLHHDLGNFQQAAAADDTRTAQQRASMRKSVSFRHAEQASNQQASNQQANSQHQQEAQYQAGRSVTPPSSIIVHHPDHSCNAQFAPYLGDQVRSTPLTMVIAEALLMAAFACGRPSL